MWKTIKDDLLDNPFLLFLFVPLTIIFIVLICPTCIAFFILMLYKILLKNASIGPRCGDCGIDIFKSEDIGNLTIKQRSKAELHRDAVYLRKKGGNLEVAICKKCCQKRMMEPNWILQGINKHDKTPLHSLRNIKGGYVNKNFLFRISRTKKWFVSIFQDLKKWNKEADEDFKNKINNIYSVILSMNVEEKEIVY